MIGVPAYMSPPMPIVLSDFTAWFGWLATVLMTINVMLGVLQPMRYDPTQRWPHRRLPASLFRLHKWIGYTAVGVVAVHPLFLLARATHPFGLAAIYVPFRAPVEPVFAGLGTLAFYLLVLVSLTSYLREQLGLRLWKLVHYAAYALLPLMIVHGIFVDPDLDPSTPIDYLDAGKLIAESCAAIVLAASFWRLRYHLRSRAADRQRGFASRPWWGVLKLVDIRDDTASVKTFRFMPPGGGELPFVFQPGQYVRVEGVRNYTIASPPTQRDAIDLTVKAEDDGFFSRHLHAALRPGQRIAMYGPLGHFVPRDASDGPILMIAGGVGITPFFSMLPELLARDDATAVTLVYSTRAPAESVGLQALKALEAAHPRFRLVMVHTREVRDESGQPARRISAELLRDVVPDIGAAQVYLCGSDAMMKDVADMLARLGVPEDAIFAESFGPARPDLRPA